MTDRESFSAGREARRAAPSTPWRPDEEHRQRMLQRYIGALAVHSSSGTDTRRPAGPGRTEGELPERGHAEQAPAGPPAAAPAPPPPPVRVRDVMDVPAVSVRDELPFLDVTHVLAREDLGAVPVVDAEDQVLGVVSVSDLLAKAAVEAEEPPAGPVGRLRDRRVRAKSGGESAGTLMTSPAVTVRPGTTVADAAWLAARSRLKRMPVTDHAGRLVGVVRRAALLQALVRDDDRIREEIETRVIGDEFRQVRDSVEVDVHDGVVDVRGRMSADGIPELLRAIGDVDDVAEVVDHLISV
ncbi:CBS domain-containing protein [Streptomyces sp. HPF1205]|uniref:CBS domain-containing protein n=1 Tax=Streptomyces sp. HPF1205 TaxID=2873262 RepID=UPI001CEC518C|nr:CBS domain-containing protein [Streptomyces sp. HPF1205]